MWNIVFLGGFPEAIKCEDECKNGYKNSPDLPYTIKNISIREHRKYSKEII